MYREFEKTTDRMIGWFMTKILDALWAIFWMLAGLVIFYGVPVLEELLRVVFDALASFTRRLIRTFEDRTGISITHSSVLTFIAWIVIWGLVILPAGAVFLTGFGTLVGLIGGPTAEGSIAVAALMAVVPLIIGLLVGSMMAVEGPGRAREVEWDGRTGFSGVEFEGGLEIGEEVRWY